MWPRLKAYSLGTMFVRAQGSHWPVVQPYCGIEFACHSLCCVVSGQDKRPVVGMDSLGNQIFVLTVDRLIQRGSSRTPPSFSSLCVLEDHDLKLLNLNSLAKALGCMGST